MPKFSTHVALMSPEYQPVSFGPGDEVPEWGVGQVGDHVLEAEEADAGDSDAAADTGEQDGEGQDDEADDEEETPPPAGEQPDFTAPAPARRGRSRKQ